MITHAYLWKGKDERALGGLEGGGERKFAALALIISGVCMNHCVVPFVSLIITSDRSWVFNVSMSMSRKNVKENRLDE